MSPETNVLQVVQFLIFLVDFLVILVDGLVQWLFPDENFQHNYLLDVGVLPHVADVCLATQRTSQPMNFRHSVRSLLPICSTRLL